MRLWTLHPMYLDAPGLVAAWREGLLAKAVLGGRTRGYRRHPQLERFRDAASPGRAINTYLAALYDESLRRGYRFDARKVRRPARPVRLSATRGQLWFEWRHLMAKLRRRSPALHRRLRGVAAPRAGAMFVVRAGPVASWERGVTPA